MSCPRKQFREQFILDFVQRGAFSRASKPQFCSMSPYAITTPVNLLRLASDRKVFPAAGKFFVDVGLKIFGRR